MTWLARMTYVAPDHVNTGASAHDGLHERHIEHDTEIAALETCHRWRRWAEQAPTTHRDIAIELERRDEHGRVRRTTRVWPEVYDQLPTPASIARHLAAARAILGEAQR